MRFLAVFSRQFPGFVFDIACDTGQRLFADLDAGRYDIVVSSPSTGQFRGELLRRFPLAWIGAPDAGGPIPDPVSLVLPPAPDALREIALKTLGEAGRSWRISVQSGSLSAIEAAVGAGLGVSIVVPKVKLYEAALLDETSGLPPLPGRDLVIERRRTSEDGGMDALYDLL